MLDENPRVRGRKVLYKVLAWGEDCCWAITGIPVACQPLLSRLIPQWMPAGSAARSSPVVHTVDSHIRTEESRREERNHETRIEGNDAAIL